MLLAERLTFENILNKLLDECNDEKHQTRVSLLLELVNLGPVVFHAGYYTTRPQIPDDRWTQSSCYNLFPDLLNKEYIESTML